MNKTAFRIIAFAFFIIILTYITTILYKDHCYHSSFLDGFWKTENGENEILMYFDTKEGTAHSIISRNGKTLSDKHYTMDVRNNRSIHLNDLMHKPELMEYTIKFELDEEESDEYDSLFIDSTYKMNVSMDRGICILQTNELSLTLIKDNAMNHKFIEYLLN